MAMPLNGKTLGTLGLGAVGQEVARLAGALGMRVIGTRRHGVPLSGLAEVFSPDQTADVLGQSDFLLLLLPATPETANFINAERLAQMKPGAWLLNFGRGHLIADADLIAAVKAKRIAARCWTYSARSHCRSSIRSGPPRGYSSCRISGAGTPRAMRPSRGCSSITLGGCWMASPSGKWWTAPPATERGHGGEPSRPGVGLCQQLRRQPDAGDLPGAVAEFHLQLDRRCLSGRPQRNQEFGRAGEECPTHTHHRVLRVRLHGRRLRGNRGQCLRRHPRIDRIAGDAADEAGAERRQLVTRLRLRWLIDHRVADVFLDTLAYRGPVHHGFERGRITLSDCLTETIERDIRIDHVGNSDRKQSANECLLCWHCRAPSDHSATWRE